MLTWVIVAVVLVALLALLGWIGSRQRRSGAAPDAGGKTSSKATGTTGAYYGDL